MRIKWTAIPNVMTSGTPAAPWATNIQPERPKPEATKEREPEKKDKKKKTERASNWLRRS